MATLSAIFKLIDNFSGPARQITAAAASSTTAISQTSSAVSAASSTMSQVSGTASTTASAIREAGSACSEVGQGASKAAEEITSAAKSTAEAGKDLASTGDKSKKLAKSLDDAGKSAKGASPKIRDIGSACNGSSSGVDNLTNKLKGLISKLALVATAKKIISTSDQLTNLTARLDNMNDGLQTTEELQQKIYNSAQRARGEYDNMADAVARLGSLAGDAFKSNDEIIAFSEILQKSFKVSGASTQEQASAMLQLSQAMASGRLQGDEYVSIMENAPAVIQSICDYLNVSKGQLKEMSSDGAISADIIKAAMFASADDIEAKFANMPVTFADMWNSIKNDGMMAFMKIQQKLTKIINNPGVQRTVSAIRVGFRLAADAACYLMDAIIGAWPTIEAILIALGTIYLVQMIIKLWAMVPPLIAQAAAWLAINWPILLIIGLIFGVIAAARHFGVTWEEIGGVVGGVLGTIYAFFYNIFVKIWNIVAAFVNFFGNVFSSPIASIKILFLDLAKNVLGIVAKLVKGIEDLINLIPGVEVNITGGIDSVIGSIGDEISKIKDESGYKEFVKTKDYMDFSEGYTKGADLGSSAASKIEGAVGNIADIMKGVDIGDKGAGAEPEPIDYSKFAGSGGSAVPIEGKGKKGKGVKVDISDENLEYIRKIAEKDYTIKVKQDVLAPNLNVSFGDVHETADVNKLQKALEKIMEDEIATQKEGIG